MTGGQGVAGSNPVTPTITDIAPHGVRSDSADPCGRRCRVLRCHDCRAHGGRRRDGRHRDALFPRRLARARRRRPGHGVTQPQGLHRGEAGSRGRPGPLRRRRDRRGPRARPGGDGRSARGRIGGGSGRVRRLPGPRPRDGRAGARGHQAERHEHAAEAEHEERRVDERGPADARRGPRAGSTATIWSGSSRSPAFSRRPSNRCHRPPACSPTSSPTVTTAATTCTCGRCTTRPPH